MDTREITKESAVVCLSHEHLAATFRSVPTVDYKEAGEGVGKFYNGIWIELRKKIPASSE